MKRVRWIRGHGSENISRAHERTMEGRRGMREIGGDAKQEAGTSKVKKKKEKKGVMAKERAGKGGSNKFRRGVARVFVGGMVRARKAGEGRLKSELFPEKKRGDGYLAFESIREESGEIRK